jgi:ArsR family transcriptional regulator
MRIYTKTDMPARLAHLLEAVAEPTRLRILNVLQAGEFCVCDLRAALELSEPMVSRHLARLRFANLVTADRDGARMGYRLTNADSPTTKILRRFLTEVSTEELALRRDLERLMRQGLPKRTGGRSSHDHHGIKEIALRCSVRGVSVMASECSAFGCN